jgi:predicted nucleic acid-binding Zn ribbon protein
MDTAQLQTIWQQRQFRQDPTPLSQPLTALMKHTLEPRVRRLGQLAEIWDRLVPEMLAEHTALEGLHNGVLTVMVDTAPARFQLNSLLKSGLQKQLQEEFPGTLRRVKLIPGRFYAVDLAGERRFDLK